MINKDLTDHPIRNDTSFFGHINNEMHPPTLTDRIMTPIFNLLSTSHRNLTAEGTQKMSESTSFWAVHAPLLYNYQIWNYSNG